MDSDIVRLLLALFLVLLNGFFVAAEFSIVKVRYSQIQLKAAEGNSMAKQAEHIIKHLDEYLSATQLGITLASLALGWVGESALHHIVENIFISLSIDLTQTTITTISVVTSFVLITIMHIVFGELIPKSIAIRKSEATTMATAVPLRVFYTIFKPFIWLMNSPLYQCAKATISASRGSVSNCSERQNSSAASINSVSRKRSGTTLAGTS